MKHAIATTLVVLVFGIATDASAEDEQRQVADPESYYQVNGLVNVFAYERTATDDARFAADLWLPQPPLKFEIAGKAKRSTGDVVYVIQFWDIQTGTVDTDLITRNAATTIALAAAPPPALGRFITSQENGNYYWITKSDFDEYLADGSVQRRHRRFTNSIDTLTWGASLTVPFKLRRRTDRTYTKLETDVTLGGYFGARWRMSATKAIYVSVVLSAGLAMLPVNSDNTASDDSMMTDEKAGDSTMLGVTIGGGIVFDLEGFQLGLMTGIDHGTGEVGRTWIYNSKQWFSFSIGYSFFGDPAEK